MTPAERQALREKHRNWLWYRNDPFIEPYLQCSECGEVGPTPCDVIKVLDATEQFYAVRPIIDEGLTFGETIIVTESEVPINWAAGK